MDAGNLVDEARFYLRQCSRVRRNGGDPLALPKRAEAALYERAQAAAARLERLAAYQPVPVPVERRRPGPARPVA